jgi:hypothetical protein
VAFNPNKRCEVYRRRAWSSLIAARAIRMRIPQGTVLCPEDIFRIVGLVRAARNSMHVYLQLRPPQLTRVPSRTRHNR